jgi:sec-independent protein translocase protein TatA
MGELIIILLIVLVVFGANKLPQIGDALGRSIKNFKKATNVPDDEKELGKGDQGEKSEKSEKKELAAAKPAKQLEEGKGEEEGDWEEVVVRRRKKSASSAAE